MRTHTSLSWALPAAFHEKEATAAAKQIRERSEQVFVMAPDKPVELFTVTNDSGSTFTGLVGYSRTQAVAGAKAQAIMRFQPTSGSTVTIQHKANVPPGYFLVAGDNGAELGAGQTYTTITPYGGSSSWSPPYSLFTSEQQRQGAAQLQKLTTGGPLDVVLGRPTSLFAITNAGGAVYRGYFELIGPGDAPRERE